MIYSIIIRYIGKYSIFYWDVVSWVKTQTSYRCVSSAGIWWWIYTLQLHMEIKPSFKNPNHIVCWFWSKESKPHLQGVLVFEPLNAAHCSSICMFKRLLHAFLWPQESSYETTDGHLPAVCILLWKKKHAGHYLYCHFLFIYLFWFTANPVYKGNIVQFSLMCNTAPVELLVKEKSSFPINCDVSIDMDIRR